MSTWTIVNIMAEYASDEGIQVPVLVGQAVVPTSIELRLCTTSNSTVLQTRIVGCLASLISILIKYIVLRTSVYSTCILIFL